MSLALGTSISLDPEFARSIDMAADMTTWVGRVVVYEDIEGGDPDRVLAMADSVFLNQLTGTALDDQMDMEGPMALMMLPADKVVVTSSRDTLADTRQALLSYRQRVDAYEREEEEDEQSSYEVDPTFYLLWQFLVSDAFFALDLDAQHMTQAVIMEVNTYMFHFFDTSLRTWDPDDLAEVCLELLPQKFFDPTAFYPSLAGVLLAYLSVVAVHEPSLDVQPLIDKIQSIAADIPTAGKDPEKWGPTKRLIAAMEARGYDPDDEQQMEDFLVEHGEALGISGEAIMAEMVDHPDVSSGDQAGMLGELLNMDDFFGEEDDEVLDADQPPENGKLG
jgi:hypothetical protein